MTTAAPIPYEEIVAQNVLTAVGISIESKPEFRTEMERALAKRWGDSNDTWRQGQCKICGANIPNAIQRVEVLGQEMQFVFGCCDSCTPLRDTHYNRSDLTQGLSRTPEWDEQCPALYKDLIANPPTSIDTQTMQRVAGWRPQQDGKGLILTGATGKGKTTSLWALFRGLELSDTRCILLTAVELQRQLSEAARDIKGVKHLTHCRVLIIDDLGKEKLTASVAALLWEVVDTRYANRRPIIISTRYAGPTFEDRFGDGVLGKDIRRRLRNCCEIVQFRGLEEPDSV